MKKNILLVVFFVCLFNLSLMAQNKTLDEVLEKYKGKEAISHIALLLDEGINAQDENAGTALIYASFYGHTEIVNVLIEADAEVNVKNKYGSTALMIASDKGHAEIVELLEAALAK